MGAAPSLWKKNWQSCGPLLHYASKHQSEDMSITFFSFGISSAWFLLDQYEIQDNNSLKYHVS